MDNSILGRLKRQDKKQTILQDENKRNRKENFDLQLALAESEEKRLQSELDIQLALAELAEGGI